MKRVKITAVTFGMLLAISLIKASPMPDEPMRTLEPIDTVRVVCIYALGEYNNPDSTHYNPQYHPLPSYASYIWEPDTYPSIPHYYQETSNEHFMVEPQVWHNVGSSYVMEGMYTPMWDKDPILEPFADSLIARIDRDNVWSFADNAMYYPDNDNPGPNDTPFVWTYIFWPEIDGNWGLAPGVVSSWDVKTTETLNGDTVFAHIFGIGRDYKTNRDDIVADIAHEFNHQWCPDIGYHPEHYGLGGFDPQAAGMMFSDAQGALPSPLNPKWRYELGWMEIKNFSSGNSLDRTVYDQTLDTLYWTGAGTDKFYFSVHRKRSHYESKWPGLGGLLIWHSKSGPNANTRYAKQEGWFGEGGKNYLDKPIDLEAAHGLWEWSGFTKTSSDPVYGMDNLDKKGYYPGPGNVGDSACFFWPEYGYTQFDGLTNPSSRGYTEDASYEVIGQLEPQRIAVRHLQVAGQNAMKADFLYNYCVPSNYPGIHIHSGANNQNSLIEAYLGNLAMTYVDNDPMLWIRFSSSISAFPDARRQLVYQGDSACYPALYSHGTYDNQIAICWLDGSSLYYRHGTKTIELPPNDTIHWNIETFELSGLDDWWGFTAPSMVVDEGDTVYIATGVSRPSTPTQIPPPPPYSLPIVCFRFYKWSPQNAVVDTIGYCQAPPVIPLLWGGYASAARDSLNRIHVVYQIDVDTVTVGRHRYYEPGSGWSEETPSYSTGCYDIGAPCLDFDAQTGRLHSVISSRHANHPDLKQVYHSQIDVSGPTIGYWSTNTRISNLTGDCFDPVMAGGYYVFWSQDEELVYKYRHQDSLQRIISHTPHAWSKSPQAVYDYDPENCHVAWREKNQFGSELDLRTISSSVGSGGSSGGQSAGEATDPISLHLSQPVFSNNLDIRYLLPTDTKNACVCIFDCQGRKVRQWRIDEASGTIRWSGSDGFERKLSPGVYFIRLSCSETQRAEKVLFIK